MRPQPLRVAIRELALDGACGLEEIGLLQRGADRVPSRGEESVGDGAGDPNNNPAPERNDEAAIAAVTGVYKAGLNNLKKLAEGK